MSDEAKEFRAHLSPLADEIGRTLFGPGGRFSKNPNPPAPAVPGRLPEAAAEYWARASSAESCGCLACVGKVVEWRAAAALLRAIAETVGYTPDGYFLGEHGPIQRAALALAAAVLGLPEDNERTAKT